MVSRKVMATKDTGKIQLVRAMVARETPWLTWLYLGDRTRVSRIGRASVCSPESRGEINIPK